jgi:hypothetical protein
MYTAMTIETYSRNEFALQFFKSSGKRKTNYQMLVKQILLEKDKPKIS